MQVIRGDFENQLHVTADLSVHGRLRAGARVAPGARLTLRGMSDGDILVERGASAELWGVVQRSILNRGGMVSIFGLVAGDVTTSENGKTWLSPDSVVRGRRRTL